jgi:hypothetical protein
MNSIKKDLVSLIMGAALLIVFTNTSRSQQEDRFVFTQLKYSGAWDSYPETWQDILQFIVVATSIKCESERRVITLDDNLLFSSPFIVILGGDYFPALSKNEREILRRYISSGGLVFVEDSSGIRGGAFDASFRREIADLFPETSLKKLSAEHPLYRSYYFLRKIGGRRLTNNYIEGIDIGGRTALVYSQNDIIGAWAKDRFGNYLWECVPGKEEQRFEAQKLTLNLIMYSVTGTYKSDAIHKPYLEMKR